MAITIGTQIGSYEVTALLGKGGMGEVYRARDTKLKREVAIKVLPDEFSRDGERADRFQREAEVLASLNHPNIGAIYDLEEADDIRFLVLELVEGETLAERIQRGPIPIEEALKIAHSICEALEAAHERGIVHRDMKPGNVKITPEGKVKVLDFGLAKALDPAPRSGNLSNSPTLTIAGTQAGMILGTAAYMSPEQAKGFNTDQRSDIFSFGAVLYEMLTRRQAFQGGDVSEILASILAREPDYDLLPPKLNPHLQRLLRRCLEKNPKNRWHAVGDLRVELETVSSDPRGLLAAEPLATVRPKPLWKRGLPVLLAVILTALTTGVAMWYFFRPSAPLVVARFPLTLGEGQRFTTSNHHFIAISPDGTQIVYVANRQLYRRSMSELEARAIPGTDKQGDISDPVFSPDGRWLAYESRADEAVKKIPISGGPTVKLLASERSEGVFSLSWTAYGIVLSEGRKGIRRLSADGGTSETVVSMKGDETAYGAHVLPDDQHVLFTLAAESDWDKARIVVQSLKTGERIVIGTGTDARYLPTGHIVYAVGGALYAVPFDLKSLKVLGGPIPVLEGVRRANNITGAAHFSFSNTGSLVYIPGPVSAAIPQQELVIVDRKGNIAALNVPARNYGFPRVSPDGKRVVFEIDDGKDSNIWTYELAGTTAMRQLTFGSANRYPIWSADGQSIAFQSDREGDLGIFRLRADVSGTAERLTKPDKGVAHTPDSWSPDNQLSYTAVNGAEAELRIFSIQDKKDTSFDRVPSKFVGRSVFSPEGRWLAYLSNETGRGQIFVQSFPGTGTKWPIVPGGYPLWSRDGTDLFYDTGPVQKFVLTIKTRPTISFGNPMPLQTGFLTTFSPALFPRNYDVTPDGKFVAVVAADQAQSGTASAPQIQVVLNWLEELKQPVVSH
jgi:serine/threonine-protein kinase